MSPVGFSPRTRSNEDWEAINRYFDAKVQELTLSVRLHNDEGVQDYLGEYIVAMKSICELVNFLVCNERPKIGDTATWGVLSGAIAARVTHVRGAQREATEDFQRFMLSC